LTGYLAKVAGPVTLVLDLRLAHNKIDYSLMSVSEVVLTLNIMDTYYPNDIHRSLNDKIRTHHTDYNNNPLTPIPFIFFWSFRSSVPHSTSVQFHNRHTVFSAQLKSKIANLLGKTAELRITLNIDDL
jgi:hypothetical protein